MRTTPELPRTVTLYCSIDRTISDHTIASSKLFKLTVVALVVAIMSTVHAHGQSERSTSPLATTVTPATKRAKTGHTHHDVSSSSELGESITTDTSTFCSSEGTATIAQLWQQHVGCSALHPHAVSKRSDYIGWDDYFMATAVLSSLRSKDPHTTRSGCCIVDPRNRIIGIGYNGFPMGASDDVLPWTRPPSPENDSNNSDHDDDQNSQVPLLHTYQPYVVHAVINAVLCSGDVQGARLFVSEFPHAECAKTIIQAGIAEVIYNHNGNDGKDSKEESDSHKASRIMFQMAGVRVRKYTADKAAIHLVRHVVEEEETNKEAPAPNCRTLSSPTTIKSCAKLDAHRAMMQKEARLESFGGTKRTDFLAWDDYFMWMAFLTAQRSKDPSTQVGACLVLDKRIVGLGYNGFPRKCSDDVLPWARTGPSPLHTKYPYVCHAEVNAILNRIFPNIRGATLYVALFPCNECAKFIVQAGIREVVYLDDKYHDTDICRASRILLSMAGVKLRQHTPADQSLMLRLARKAADILPTHNDEDEDDVNILQK